MIYSFPPAVNTYSRILVIGSMPGKASLQAQEYYAYKYNQFWRMIFDIFAGGRQPENYADKINTLLKYGIGLWDALASCERTGNLDGNISLPRPNDFPALFKEFPHIHTLLFNGQAARAHFKRAFGTCHKDKHIIGRSNLRANAGHMLQ
ncbi:MAG: DNA-deoxyinosine glycosylase [Candidatus Avelusimicrobium sp.]|uniref:DNA-deoxyinosine glycosylase n=1 Tax=Candidatus Avelusimicrobium sp. TaxID=3048833 RepID=UPI003F0ADF6E